MKAAGDKMVTNGRGNPNGRARKGGKAGPHATVKFGSASVPIYRTESKERVRFILTHYRDGKRLRQVFSDLAAAKKEAMFVAQRIQSGMQHVTDLKPHERDNYTKAVELLRDLDLPLVAAVEDSHLHTAAANGDLFVKHIIGASPGTTPPQAAEDSGDDDVGFL